MRLPTFAEQQLDSTDTFQLDIRFKFTEDNPHEYLNPINPDVWRNIVGTNNGARNSLGFNVFVEKVDGSSSIALMVGEGTGREGYLFYIDTDLEDDSWHELSLIFSLNEEKPRIRVIFDGAPSNLYLTETERVENAKLLEFFSGGNYPENIDLGLGGSPAGLFVGGFPSGDPINQGMSLSLDSINFQTKKADQDSERLNEILELAKNNIKNSVPTPSALIQEFIKNFTGDWDAIETNAILFLNEYFATDGAIFSTEEQLQIGNFSAPKKLAYYLQQWIFDNLYDELNIAKTKNLPKFPDASIYPGSVADGASRITKEIIIDGTYKTDPGYFLNNQETVLRPTGLYAPPGEIITISSASDLSQSKIKVRIGISFFDLEATWTVYNRFPRIGNQFSLTSQLTEIANPFGGGIYIEVPDGSELGDLSLTVEGAVEMPTYALESHQSLNNSVEKFVSDINNAQVPYFELIGNRYNLTHPIRFGPLYTEPKKILEKLDLFFTSIDTMTGRPPGGIRAEWVAGDRMIPVAGTAMAASYPIHGDVEGGPYSQESVYVDGLSWSPLQYLNSDYYKPDVSEDIKNQRLDAFTLWHELGHLHNLPTLGCQEAESNVHLLYTVLADQVLGADLDTALRYSGFQHYDRNDAALDTMFSPNWQIDERLCIDAWDNEVRYQTRSWARLVEIAGLYGWDSVGKIHKAFYDRGVLAGEAVNYGIEDDDFIKTASIALNLNLAPLFEFWGVPASALIVKELESLPPPAAFKERLVTYRNLIPNNEEEYLTAINKLAATTGSAGRWDNYRANYDPNIMQIMRDKIDRIQSAISDVDSDGDGQPNLNDLDDDNDGVQDIDDAFPLDPTENTDSDGDGVGDNADPDDDNDGIPDIPLLTGSSNTEGATSNAKFYGGARVDDRLFEEIFAADALIDVIAEISVEEKHLNTAGNIYVIAQYLSQYYQLVEHIGFEVWDGLLEGLKPAVNGKTLNNKNRIMILNDAPLGAVGLEIGVPLLIYVAYESQAEVGKFYYGNTPISITIRN